MLTALTAADALAIADIALRRSRDERAMVEYLGIGRRRDRSAGMRPSHVLRPTPVDLVAFESDERAQLHDALANLTKEARRELLALVFLGRSPSLSFDAALRRTRRIPAEAQAGYLLGQCLERHVPAGLEKLGYPRRSPT